jgi:hypothetical protein
LFRACFTLMMSAQTGVLQPPTSALDGVPNPPVDALQHGMHIHEGHAGNELDETFGHAPADHNGVADEGDEEDPRQASTGDHALMQAHEHDDGMLEVEGDELDDIRSFY